MAVIGIDLGTTNTVVGVVRDGQAAPLRDENDQHLIPSVVSFHPSGNVLVGGAAKERRLVDAGNTIYSIKRLIGRSFGSDEVDHARKRFPFEMREGPGQAALVVARGETFTLPEISAFVLRHAKALAEQALGEAVERAVITVPANFNDLQRAATKVAGRVAGLEVLRILNEPTAAALAYGYGKATSERIVIYDFGGGTFDVTLLDLSGNVFEVLATAGNTLLGGDDIDLAIAERMAGACVQEHRFDPRDDPQAFEQLKVAAERVKVALASAPSHTEQVPDLSQGAFSEPLGLRFTMTREEFDSLAAAIVEQTFDVCREALSIARLGPDDFDQVILVGGSTRLPLVRQKVQQFFGRPPLDRVSPDEVVAIGAAIQANALTGQERRRSAIPKPPMPAARTTESTVGPNPAPPAGGPPARKRRSQPPPLPKQRRSQPPPNPRTKERRTNPFGERSSSAPPKPRLPTPARTAEPPGPHRRRTTGVGLGPPPAPAAPANPRAFRLPRPEAVSAVGSAGMEEAGEDEAPAHGGSDRPAMVPYSAQEETTTQLGGPEETTQVGSPEALRGLRTAAAEDAAPRALESLPPTESLPPLEPQSDRPAELDEVLEPSTADRDAFDPNTIGADSSPDRGTAPQWGAPVSPPVPDPPAGAGSPSGQQGPSPAAAGAAAAAGLSNALPSELPSPMAGGSEPTPGFAGSLESIPPVASTPARAEERDFAPAEPSVRRIDPAGPPAPHAPLPLLVDVTPLSLTVETVGGYSDVIIPRNTPVPCEQSRAFVTARDEQTSVVIRVGQGGSPRFEDNTLLGQVELSGLPPAPRGQTQVTVTFALDTDGILNVRATNTETGAETDAHIRLVGMPDGTEIDELAARHAAHPPS